MFNACTSNAICALLLAQNRWIGDHLLGEGDLAVGDSLILELPALRTGLLAKAVRLAPPPTLPAEKGDTARVSPLVLALLGSLALTPVEKSGVIFLSPAATCEPSMASFSSLNSSRQNVWIEIKRN